MVGIDWWVRLCNDTLCITLKITTSLQAVESSGSSMVAYEIALNVHRLVSKYGRQMEAITWSAVLDLLQALLRHLGVSIIFIFDPVIKEDENIHT